MLQNRTIRKLFIQPLMLLGIATTTQAQDIRPQPKFWFGASAAANFNFYTGTTQTLNSTVMAPTAFHKGFGVDPYGSVFMEYRPNPILGFMLNLGYDGRGGSFDKVNAPCDCPESLKTNLSYVTIEPSLRVAPFSNGFYLFIGGAYSYNIDKSFTYTQKEKPDAKGDFSDVRQRIFSGQVGAGFDIPLSSVTNSTQINLSPFVSYHPYFGQEPRSIESWSLSTVRVGVALKFGKVREKSVAMIPAVIPAVALGEIKFSVKAPLTVPVKRKTKETFPLRNYVFFDEGSSEIPNRYVKLQKDKAVDFKEAQLQEPEPKDAAGRSQRQLSVYYNMLNVVGDRMRKDPSVNVKLIGASAGKGAELGKTYAESVKHYLVDVFAINEARITTEGRDEPVIPSEQPGGKTDLVRLRDGDRRVDIVSTSPDLLAPLQISAIQADPLDSRIVFKAAGAKELLRSWTLEVENEKGTIQRFGPFTKEQESISGNSILGDRAEGNYKVAMIGLTKDGNVIRKESTLHLVHNAVPKEEGLRFSILFDFDKSKTVVAYEKFLTEVVVPLIPNNGTVIIHGHSDDIGDEYYNLNLSLERALDVQHILQQAISGTPKTGITYETYGFGDDADFAPFENKLPEERFYNRTVIIDIVSPMIK